MNELGAAELLSNGFSDRSSFGYQDLVDCANGKLFGPDNAQLPAPPMLMFDRVTNIKREGGAYGKGELDAELDVKSDGSSQRKRFGMNWKRNNLGKSKIQNPPSSLKRTKSMNQFIAQKEPQKLNVVLSCLMKLIFSSHNLKHYKSHVQPWSSFASLSVQCVFVVIQSDFQFIL